MTSVQELFESIGRTPSAAVAWGEWISTKAPGVYAIAISDDPKRIAGGTPAFCDERIGAWIEQVPGMTLDGEKPTVEGLREYLRGYWLSDEPIVYIGTATRLRTRLRQFAIHKLGAKSPHAGGHWLKTLGDLEKMSVFYAEAESPTHARELEAKAVTAFAERVSAATAAKLVNPLVPIPFANRVWPGRARKSSRLRYQVFRRSA